MRNHIYLVYSPILLNRKFVLVFHSVLGNKRILNMWHTHNKNTIGTLDCCYESYVFNIPSWTYSFRVLPSFAMGSEALWRSGKFQNFREGTWRDLPWNYWYFWVEWRWETNLLYNTPNSETYLLWSLIWTWKEIIETQPSDIFKNSPINPLINLSWTSK